MLFNSVEFAIFLPLVFLLYWFVFNKKLKLQNFFVVSVSYLFYGWWDWRFLLLMGITTLCSYLSGTLIDKYRSPSVLGKYPHACKIIAVANIVLNLLILGLFKYFNFFAENFGKLFELFGYTLDWVTLDILLPVGISFYTFQALSYTIDVYKRKLEPTHDIVAFFAYVSFFPQLVAGPIERSVNLLSQFYVKRYFNYTEAVSGMRQILWGLFKKIVVADSCAPFVNQIFSNYESLDGATLFIGALLFTFQIYGDFSGYSDIAIGTARLFGIRLMRNFNFPYFSRDVAEFWRRWHISLTTWFRDYIYIPLGGSRGSRWLSFRNTMIIFLVSGLWHGANWTFVAWGAYHAILFLPLLLLNKNRKYKNTVAEGRCFPGLKEIGQMLCTFILVLFGWILFRSDSIGQACEYIGKMMVNDRYYPYFVMQSRQKLMSFVLVVVSILMLVAGEWIASRKGNDFYTCNNNRFITVALILFILFVGSFRDQLSFIYFQF